jgi:AraC family transcriptional regulator of adaptative response/methylated-DNA-[protein]-cysteine methyltransferase
MTDIEKDPRWARMVARDRTADGQFWYSVATTAVYCRPSCPSRGCNPKNVAFHDSLEAAKATGFRACKRCNPEGVPRDVANARLVEEVCRLIERSEEMPSLGDAGGCGGLEQEPFPSAVQGGNRIDAQGLCRRASGRALPRASGEVPVGDRGDVRRRLQFERAPL